MTWQTTRVTTQQQPLAFTDDKLRFVWVSDSHVDTLTSTEAVALLKAIDDCNAWRPQAFVNTGDMGNNLLTYVQTAAYLLQTCQRPVLSVVGNHDELGDTALTPPTAELMKPNVFNRNPLYTSTTVTSGDGTVTALCLLLDGNYYADDPDDPPPGSSDVLEPGDRYGAFTGDPSVTGYWRMFTAAQLAWVEATLAADTTSDIVIVIVHYPPQGVGCVDYTALADILQADGRPTIGMAGHQHIAGSSTLTSTDTLASFTFYQMLDMQSTGGYCRFILSVSEGVISVDSAVIYNYTDPGGYTINAPFTTP